MVLRLFILAALFLSGCGDIERDNPYDPNSSKYDPSLRSSASGSATGGERYNYCVFPEQHLCMSGPFSSCQSGGILGNDCPYGDAASSSLQPQAAQSSSSSSLYSSSSRASSSSIASSSSRASSSSAASSSSSAPVPSSSSIASSSSRASSSSAGSAYVGKGNNISNYKTVTIGSQTWMAENLDYNVSGSRCWDNQDSYCAQYGRLYGWNAAMSACPSGWHLPSNEEWNTLYHYADGTSYTDYLYDSPTAGLYLKATSGWNGGGNGQDTYGFAALPGGYGRLDVSFSFYNAGDNGYYWSASDGGASGVYYRLMSYDSENARWYRGNEGFYFSVRCLQD